MNGISWYRQNHDMHCKSQFWAQQCLHCLLGGKLNITDEGWEEYCINKSHLFTINPSRKFLSHENKYRFVFSTKHQWVNSLNTKSFNPIDRFSVSLWVDKEYLSLTSWEVGETRVFLSLLMCEKTKQLQRRSRTRQVSYFLRQDSDRQSKII